MPKSTGSCKCGKPGCSGVHKSRDYRRRRTLRDRALREQAKQPFKQPDPNLLSVAPRQMMPQAPQPMLTSPSKTIVAYPDLSHFPPPSSSSSIEQEMLDNGTMSVSDLHLDTPLPSLPSGIHSGDMLMACVEHYEEHNSATSASASRLSASVAYSLPGPTPEEKRAVREFEREVERIQRDMQDFSLSADSELPPSDADDFLPPVPDLPLPSVIDEDGADGQYSDEDADDNDTDNNGNKNDVDVYTDANAVPIECSSRTLPLHEVPVFSTDVDDPDPFNHSSPSRTPFGLDDTPSHLICIYAIVSWLHLNFHLSRVACNAILWSFALVLSAVAPAVALPFVTLKSANHALGLDILPATILPVCPSCKEVFPSSDDTPNHCARCSTPLFKEATTTRGNQRRSRVPLLKYPTMSLTNQLELLLATPGVEDLLDSWRHQPREGGVYRDIFDGAVTKNLLGPDGGRFFVNDGPQHSRGPNGDLHIGLAWGVDWFSYLRSNIAPSHSSCPTSFSIVNLPPDYRYRTANLLLTGIIPGPGEQTGDELQRFMRPVINELIRLWKDGARISTPSCPEGRLVRVILVAVVCDKPAAHKIAGFGSHSHTMFCTRCWITKEYKDTPRAFKVNEFRARTNAEHRRQGNEYANLKTDSARKAYTKANAVRFTQLSRLPYFDLVRQVVVDPMHNLYLGLVKTHFYHIWVQTKVLREKHELKVLHELLDDFSLPSSAGKLPKDIGIPAGGSLTADQWKLLAIFHGPIIVPQLWRRCMPEDAESCRRNRLARVQQEEKKKVSAKAERAAKAASKKAEKAMSGDGSATADKGKSKKGVKSKSGPGDTSAASSKSSSSNTPPSTSALSNEMLATLSLPEQILSSTSSSRTSISPSSATVTATTTAATTCAAHNDDEDAIKVDEACNLHPDDPSNFLKLSEALRILAQYTLTEDDISNADHLLREYCAELITLYGRGCIRPNHHYATHTAEFVRDFGPLHGFWSFLFERLNKVLKAYNTNNHGTGGELETTFFTEFHRTCASARMTYTMHATGEDTPTNRLATVMLNATHDERGTAAGMSSWMSDLEDEQAQVQVNSHKVCSLSVRQKTVNMPSDLYMAMLRYFWSRYPAWHVHSRFEQRKFVDSVPLTQEVISFDYIILNGQRFYAERQSGNAGASLVEAEVPWSDSLAAGRLLDIIQFQQDPRYPPSWFAHIRWFKPRTEHAEAIWETFKRLGVRLWYLQEYLDSDMNCGIIEVTQLRGLLGRLTVTVGDDDVKAWATVPFNHAKVV